MTLQQQITAIDMPEHPESLHTNGANDQKKQ